MNPLPQPLRPFAESLSLFGALTIDGIGPWLPRLHALLGPIAARSDDERGDIDGYDGLTRRGLYERLIASEWALATVDPLEFERRVAMHEQLFLRVRRLAPHGAHRSVALFDAGPWQLGHPRLVQLALLAVLARRAREARGEFQFGVLQDHPPKLHDFDARGIRTFLATRSNEPAAPTHLAAWTERLTAAKVQANDRWVVGWTDVRSVAGDWASGVVEISEPRHTQGLVQVSVHHRDGRRSGIALQMPAPEASLHVLRHALAEPEPPKMPTRFEGTSDRLEPILTASGRRLLLRKRDGTFSALHVPGSPREPRGGDLSFRVPERLRVRAVGLARTKVLVVLAESQDEALGWYDARQGWGAPRYRIRGDDRPTWIDGALPLEVETLNGAFLVDGEQRLWRIGVNPHQHGYVDLEREPVPAVERWAKVASDEVMVLAREGEAGPKSLGVFCESGHRRPLASSGLVDRVLLGGRIRSSTNAATPEYAYAVRVEDDRWAVLRGETTQFAILDPSRGEPIALLPQQVPSEPSSVLVLGAERRSLFAVVVGSNVEVPLCSHVEPITWLRYHPMSQHVVFRSQRYLGVYSCARQGMLLLLESEGA